MLNTFPPLISGTSYDAEGLKQLVGTDSRILASCSIRETPTDAFFHPELGLSGYGWDGVFYYKGIEKIPVRPKATWFTEAINPSDPAHPYRSTIPFFPKRGIALATSEGLTIFDEASGSLDVWMTFIKDDPHALLNRFTPGAELLTPNSLSYNNGILVLSFLQDVDLYIDFNQDSAYADTPMLPPPEEMTE